MLFLPVLVVLVIWLRSLMAIIWYLELRKRNRKQAGIMLAAGIAGLLLALLLYLNHAVAGLRFVWGTSVAFTLIGIFEVYLFTCLRKLRILSAEDGITDQTRSAQ